MSSTTRESSTANEPGGIQSAWMSEFLPDEPAELTTDVMERGIRSIEAMLGVDRGEADAAR